MIRIDLRNIVKWKKIRNRRRSKAKYHLYKLKTYTKKTTPCIFSKKCAFPSSYTKHIRVGTYEEQGTERRNWE